MNNLHSFTDEEKAELLSNPYTARISDSRVTFTLEFKKLVINNIDLPEMTAEKVFGMAGYRKELFSPNRKRGIVRSIRQEAASAEGLKEPKPARKHIPRKKHSETEFKELQKRVAVLEQQVNFLKKSYALKKQDHSKPPGSSS